MMQKPNEDPAENAFVMRHRDVETGAGKITISTLVCEPLERAGFLNAFSTRIGGVSSLPHKALSLAYFKGDSKENTAENRRRFLKALGAEQVSIVTARQTHSTERCAIESAQDANGPQLECDALITRLKGVLLGIQTADCIPILIADTYQSNHEGRLIDRLQERDFDGSIVNAGGLTHTSVALRDALLAIARPFVEVHLSDPSTREPFRSVNFLHDVAIASVVGKGGAGYVEALELLVDHLRRPGRDAAG